MLFDVMKMAPIMRFRTQKRTAGVNQLATSSTPFITAPATSSDVCFVGEKRERES